MKQRKQSCRALGLALVTALALTLVLALAAGAAPAAQTGGYDLTWNVIGSGYTYVSGGAYRFGSTAGQPGAGSQLGGGGYTLTGGFWTGEGSQAELGVKTYLPMLKR